MFLKLRIIFTILSAICLAAILPVGSFLDLYWAIGAAAAAGVFFFLMLICKQEQEKREPLQEETPKQEPSSEDKAD